MVVTPVPVRYEVARLTLPITGVREFQARYEAAVPPIPVDAIDRLVASEAPWTDMNSSSTSATTCTR
jgi:hypothetical protein